jgi:hypothetical protein
MMLSKEVALEISIVKLKYILLFHNYNAGQNQDIKIGTRLFENVTLFKYFGTIVTCQKFDSGGY